MSRIGRFGIFMRMHVFVETVPTYPCTSPNQDTRSSHGIHSEYHECCLPQPGSSSCHLHTWHVAQHTTRSMATGQLKNMPTEGSLTPCRHPHKIASRHPLQEICPSIIIRDKTHHRTVSTYSHNAEREHHHQLKEGKQTTNRRSNLKIMAAKAHIRGP